MYVFVSVFVCVFLCVNACIYISHLFHSSLDKHMGFFHILAIINNATLNIGMHISFELVFSFSLELYPVVKLVHL